MDKYDALAEAQKQIKSAIARLRHADTQLERYPSSIACQDYLKSARVKFDDASRALRSAAIDAGVYN